MTVLVARWQKDGAWHVACPTTRPNCFGRVTSDPMWRLESFRTKEDAELFALTLGLGPVTVRKEPTK
jgi:hypothetical protein